MGKTGIAGLIFTLLLGCLPGVLLGEDNSLVLSVSAKEEYNDNVFYSDSREEDDLVTTVSPKIEWETATERMNAAVSAKIDRILYQEYDELDQTDQMYAAKGGYHFTDQFSVSSRASYLRDSRRERDLETTGLVQDDSTRKRWQCGVSGEYLLSEKDVFAFSVAFDEDDFERTGESDYDSWHTTLTYFRSLDPATRLSAQAGYAVYNYDLSDIENYSVTMGASRNFNEAISLDAQLGGRFTRTERMEARPVSQTVEKDSSGIIGNLNLNYAGDYSALSFSVNHDVRSASGRNGTTNRTSLVVSAHRRLSDKWFMLFSGGYYLNDADAGELGTEDIDERTIRIHPRIQYRFNRNLSMGLAYRYAEIEDKIDKTTVRNSAATLRINWNYDLFE